ncbi:hypothetical protein CVT24_002043 [Panaeolus cyanescens]|uniref:Uncharacterized protein n=1 Tax=Panaeolus cyanescens TaxID=181874 RepID=A0A409YHM6_9AGAR|nr:hypothetical protein CVT24_002043 [Panaeolus cyanescens]
MSSSNINDPAAITALLEQLKSSTAWQQLTASQAPSSVSVSAPVTDSGPSQHTSTSLQEGINPENSHIDALSSSTTVENPISSSVAELLSQLNTVSTEPAVPTQARVSYPSTAPHFSPANFPSALTKTSRTAVPLPDASPDLRNLSFVQSLPLISQLAEDPNFLSSIAQMKNEQNALERKLWLEREAIYDKYQSKIKMAQTKANLIGTSVSKHEIDADNFKKELARFDVDRVLPAWDGLVLRQQQELAQLKLPTMFATAEKEDREATSTTSHQRVGEYNRTESPNSRLSCPSPFDVINRPPVLTTSAAWFIL